MKTFRRLLLFAIFRDSHLTYKAPIFLICFVFNVKPKVLAAMLDKEEGSSGCRPKVDVQIITCLIEKGVWGALPKDIASALKDYELNRFQVLRRIQHMNKLLYEEVAHKVAEKHGHKWALTEFTREAYDKTKEELSQKDEEKV